MADNTLAAGASCIFNLALSDEAEADETYIFATTGTNASNSPSTLSFTVEGIATGCIDDKCRVFVTNSSGTGDFSTWGNASGASGIEAANNICAGDDNNPDDGTVFKAWVSTTTINAKDNISYNDSLAYYRLDNITLIVDANLLLDTDITPFTNAIDLEAVAVKTGTLADGVINVGNTCADWTSVVGESEAATSTATNSTWTTNPAWVAPDNCGFIEKLYCFEVQ